jgi:hypothetical protein
MTPFVRRTSPQGVSDLPLVPEDHELKASSSTSTTSSNNMNEESNNNNVDFPGGKKQNKVGTWDRRRRRLHNKKRVDDSRGTIPATPSHDGRKGSLWRKKDEDDDDIDPYDSDPGESYREHCMKVKGFSSKSCLAMPAFLRNSRTGGMREEESELTAPPSPMTSEMGDAPTGVAGQSPSSLPNSLKRVRYSLRSSITDGSEKQPTGPSVMERRELRPNNVHLNVSHWSDEGGRPYMEDRYVNLLKLILPHDKEGSDILFDLKIFTDMLWKIWTLYKLRSVRLQLNLTIKMLRSHTDRDEPVASLCPLLFLVFSMVTAETKQASFAQTGCRRTSATTNLIRTI